MFTPQLTQMIKSEETMVNSHRPFFGSGTSARISSFAKRTSRRRDVIGFELSPFSALRY
jgi:hypothetical protein